MENAAKALLIAGAVLLAMMGIATVIYVFSQTSIYFTSETVEQDAKNLKEFNAQFEAFNRNDLWGADIVSVANKIANNNADPENIQIRLIITVNMSAHTYVFRQRREYDLDEIIEQISTGMNYEDKRYQTDYAMGTIQYDTHAEYRTFKTSKFQCIGITYDDITGRVNEMIFEQT